MKKIAFAIDNKSAETKIAEYLNANSGNETYEVVGTLLSNESVLDFFKSKTTDILVYIEGLAGSEDPFDFAIKLHRKHPSLRIVFIAGQRSVGDKKLATLVAYHIYDIVAGDRVLVADIANRILHEATFNDVIQYLPDQSGDFFAEAGTSGSRDNKVKAAQANSNRLAEKALGQQQLFESKASLKEIRLKLDAADARIRQLEDEKSSWEAEAGRERLFLEKKFDSDKSVLVEKINALEGKISKLSAEKTRLETSLSEKTKQLEKVENDLKVAKGADAATLTALKAEVNNLTKELDAARSECDDCKNRLASMKANLEAERANIVNKAKADAEAIMQKAEETARLTEEDRREVLAQKERLQDKTFEEFVKTETERIEREKSEAERQIQEALAGVSAQKQAILDQTTELREKYQALKDELDAEMKDAREQAKNEKREAAKETADERIRLQNELVALMQELGQKKAELQAVQNSVDITRQEKNAEIETLNASYQKKIDEINNSADEKIQRAQYEIAKEIEEKRKEAEAAFAAEKKRAADDYTAYKDRLEEEKRRLTEGDEAVYRFEESKFVLPDRAPSKCKVLAFFGSRPGCGNSTVALNTAAYLAKKGRRTVYIELDWQNPSLKSVIGIPTFHGGIEQALKKVASLDFAGIDAQIVFKQKILNMKVVAKEMHSKYPDMLNMLTFSPGAVTTEITPDLVRGLIAYLKHRKNCSYIIIDVPAYVKNNIAAAVASASDKFLITLQQDFASINSTIAIKNMIRENASARCAEDCLHVINCYNEKTLLPAAKIIEMCTARPDKTFSILSDRNAMLVATSKAAPVVLTATNAQLLTQIKSIGDAFEVQKASI